MFGMFSEGRADLIFGLYNFQIIGVRAESVKDILLVPHPRLKLLTGIVEPM